MANVADTLKTDSDTLAAIKTTLDGLPAQISAAVTAAIQNTPAQNDAPILTAIGGVDTKVSAVLAELTPTTPSA